MDQFCVAQHVYGAAGVYMLKLTVTDDRGATASDTAIVKVLTPAQASSDLKSDVIALPLQSGIKQSLTSKLDAAIAHLNAGQTNAALNVLQAFINHVKAQKGKHIPAAVADFLIAEAVRIMNAM